MDRGFLLGKAEPGAEETKWVGGAAEPSFWQGIKVSNKQRLAVEAYRCPTCFTVRLFAPPA
jgi:hypothetical protein